MRSHLLEIVCALEEESSTECFAQTVEEMRTYLTHVRPEWGGVSTKERL